MIIHNSEIKDALTRGTDKAPFSLCLRYRKNSHLSNGISNVAKFQIRSLLQSITNGKGTKDTLGMQKNRKRGDLSPKASARSPRAFQSLQDYMDRNRER